MAYLTSPTGVKVSVNDAAAEVLISAGWKADGVTEKSETPDKSWTVADLKAHADENGVDLGDATKKADILAAIDAYGDDRGDESTDN